MLPTRSLNFLTPVLAAGFLLLPTLAGCGGSPPLAGAPAMGRTAEVAGGQPRMDASGCGKSVVYVTSYDNSVYIYNQKHNGGASCGQITGLTNPQGLFVDEHGNVWVAIAGDCRKHVLQRAGVRARRHDAHEDPPRSRRSGYRRRRRQ
jgi:hypothetical protein